MVPPDPIPNSEVKRRNADGSVGLPHVRVGHRQVDMKGTPATRSGVFYWRRIAKGEKDKQPKTSDRRQVVVKRGEETETRHSLYSSHKQITKPLQCGAQTDVQSSGLSV